ncbi:MAG TPA: ATP-dependent DNA helicase PcrA, partial [Candidatus Moranbacteria bacterium]|nr:ATP-dependent DNA helicase PcrA [Candidatus Moranbacteria bacterium]
MEDILSGLNEKQVEAVTAPDGPLLVLAGAGSGKTKTLTHRVAYLIKERGLEPGSILTVTFTNKAAEEMKGRIRALLGERIDPPLMGTFHSVCANFLRRDIDRLGWERNFSIIDAADQLSLIKSLMKELSFDPKQISPRAVIAGISRAKNSLVSPAVAAERADSHFEEIVAKIFAAYEARLRQIGALDFDDLLVMTVRLWQENEDVLHRYRERFSHILVDEYQDTNHIQYRLINLLAGERKNIFVIGDDYQSIYSFRAADIGNILNFRRDYPHSRVITLERNYRSSGNILAAASEVISRNRSQHHKKLRTDREAGEKITVCAAASEKDEAAFVAEEIDALRESGRSWGEITILYRANSQSRNLEEAFIRAGVPYRIVGGLKFYDRKE